MYLPETNVLLTRFMSADAVCEIIDFMPVSSDGDDLENASNCVIRIVRAIYGTVSLDLRCAPRFDYARIGHDASHEGTCGVRFEAHSTDGKTEPVTLDASIELSIEDGDAVARFELKQGDSACFVFGAASDPIRHNLRGEEALADTIGFWRRWSGQSTYRGRYREVVMRSALLLKLLSSRESGAIVAAPTFGLPETPDGRRRWDYRFTWIRDAAFSGYALLRLGYTGEAQNFMRWISERNKRCGSDGSLMVMYAVDGRETPEEEVLDHLHGSGDEPPLIGNAARDQMQPRRLRRVDGCRVPVQQYGEAMSLRWLGQCDTHRRICGGTLARRGPGGSGNFETERDRCCTRASCAGSRWTGRSGSRKNVRCLRLSKGGSRPVTRFIAISSRISGATNCRASSRRRIRKRSTRPC